ncbi:polysaccharide biosynthesis/export family protein [Hymenobacter sp. BT730]|uniref:polysaccharide biosynthesis/export family protein n=1 Tax=Hymenobacter sp. BT730 TaxID=3063332 RepID=UPI0026E0C1B2|nr:polysaccharide biosynthesis/export family protein [Hymenobacter sp. BT730]
MRITSLRPLVWFLLVQGALLSSCASSRLYKQNIMFRTEGSTAVVDTSKLRDALGRLGRNYIIRPNDYLQVRVYTNRGERLLDPNGELRFGVPGNQSVQSGVSGSTLNNNNAQGAGNLSIPRGGDVGSKPAGEAEFLVQADGRVKLPMVDFVKVSGYTLVQADSVLQLRYNTFYKESFVATRVTNSRVFVLGAPGGRIVPLYNENMNLLEVLSAIGGIDATGINGSIGGGANMGGRLGKAYNIRLIRGDLRNPQVQVVDLSTIDGMRKADLQIHPNDIIYVEPVRKPFTEAVADILPILSTITSVITTVLLINNLSK